MSGDWYRLTTSFEDSQRHDIQTHHLGSLCALIDQYKGGFSLVVLNDATLYTLPTSLLTYVTSRPVFQVGDYVFVQARGIGRVVDQVVTSQFRTLKVAFADMEERALVPESMAIVVPPPPPPLHIQNNLWVDQMYRLTSNWNLVEASFLKIHYRYDPTLHEHCGQAGKLLWVYSDSRVEMLFGEKSYLVPSNCLAATTTGQ